jgi:hypothetical protein
MNQTPANEIKTQDIITLHGNPRTGAWVMSRVVQRVTPDGTGFRLVLDDGQIWTTKPNESFIVSDTFDQAGLVEARLWEIFDEMFPINATR